MVGDRREVLSPMELGAVALQALSDGLLDVASERRRGAAVALQEQHSRPGLVGDVSPDLDHHTPARARRDGPGWRRRRSVMAVQPPGLCEAA